MNIVVNGEKLKVKNDITIEELLEELSIKDKVMAVAINMEIVKKEDWSKYIIQENDKLELLHFVGGG
jgi:sulfur carrier protein